MRAAVYVRLSQETDRTTSPQRQRQDAAKLIEARGWTHNPDADLFEDIDVSAWSGTTRPAWEQLLDQLDRYDVIVYWKLDRLVRRGKDLHRLLELCETHDVRLVSVTEGDVDLTSPMGRAMTQIAGVFADLESANISTRIKAAQRHIVRTQKFPGGVVPYGWRLEDGRLHVHPDEAPVVREMVDRIIEGEAYTSIAGDLNRRSVPTRKGGDWHGRTVSKIVSSPRLVGWRPHDGHVVTDDDGLPVQLDPPLIDETRWQALQRAMKGRDRRRNPNRSRQTLLGGILTCGKCGSSMHGWTADHPAASYICSRASSTGRTICEGNTISRQHTDRLVEAAVREVLDDVHLEEPEPDPTVDRRIAQLESALDRLEDDRLYEGLYDDAAGRARYARRVREITDELARLRQPSEAPRLADVAGDDAADRWGEWPVERRREVTRALTEEIVVLGLEGAKVWDPDRIKVVWAY